MGAGVGFPQSQPQGLRQGQEADRFHHQCRLVMLVVVVSALESSSSFVPGARLKTC